MDTLNLCFDVNIIVNYIIIIIWSKIK